MAFLFKFDVEEAPDAKTITFYDTTGYNILGSLSNPEGWTTDLIADIATATLTMEVDSRSYTYNLPVGAGFEVDWANGIPITLSDLAYPELSFEDGMYDFTVNITFGANPAKEENIVVGFFAIILGKVMVKSLQYREGNSKEHREYILELNRLIDNLYYSTQTGQLDYFQSNLAQLEKIIEYVY